ncbi:MAG: ECF transporter S component [Ruminococcaceae bacterium]|nr:ECF transporter S component [Oscillospiraceae bacterium]
MKTHKTVSPRVIAATAMMGAASAVLMLLSFPMPFLIPGFIKMDFSELPALIASFALGPWWGVLVCLIKNLINVTMTTTGGVGELANFLLGAAFVLPAGYLYRFKKNRVGALLGSFAGAVASALLSFPINLFITYPFYAAAMIPMETIVGMYSALLPSVDTLEECLLIFNLPFTLLKGVIVTGLTFLVYKPLSVLIKGKGARK